jgi:hypothetical protein
VGRTQLLLPSNDIGDLGVTALMGSPHLGSLTHLHLGGNNIGDSGARAIVNHSPGGLEVLDLDCYQISDDVYEELTRHLGPDVERWSCKPSRACQQ